MIILFSKFLKSLVRYSFVGIVLLLFVSVSQAEELILEYDPDEELSVEEVSDMPEQKENLDINRSSVLQDKKNYVEGYKQLFEMNESEIAGLEAVLIPLDEDISSIDIQLQVINLQIERIKSQEVLIQGKMQGLIDLDTKFRVREKLMSLEMKSVVEKFSRVITMFFRVKRQFVMEDGRVNLVQLITNSESPADLVFQDFLLQKVQDQLLIQMGDIYGNQSQLGFLRNQLQIVGRQLVLNQERLQSSAQVLLQQADFKEKLLAEKEHEQNFFQKALADSKEEQLIIADRIRVLASGVSVLDYQSFPKEAYLWPVTPLLGISTFFKDSGYKLRFGMEHNAIDIPTDQLTPVRAPLSGRVIELYDGGKGYSYLQLAHRDGFSTVYGHVYLFKVKKGDNVQRGEVIALSGGAIGTNGAGRMTTGPHLHFELLKNGKYIDPLKYLPKIDKLK